MICGRNYHGGNVQDGCGASFIWTDARPYVPAVVRRPPEDEEVKEIVDIPPIAREYRHEGYLCDRCHKEIVGLRFSCMHCPAVDFCEKCEMEATLEHNKNHVFRIISMDDALFDY